MSYVTPQRCKSSQGVLAAGVSRPLAWIIAPAIWFSGIVHSGNYALTIEGILFAVALSFPIFTFGVNDVYDYHSDMNNKRKDNLWTDGTPLSLVHHRYILQAAKSSSCFVILLVLPASTRSAESLICTILLLCLVWLYSLPPFRLKERPIWDSLSNGVICWLFWACGYTFGRQLSLSVHSEMPRQHGWLVFWYASALHSMAAMVDEDADSAAKHHTIATVYGERFAAIFSTFCFVFASLTIDMWSDVGITICAAPHTKYSVVRIVFGGSYLCSIIWVLKKAVQIHNGQDVAGKW
ncbi:prenyltransferase [Paraphoma chrysanthemicola]|nr:prenyltransferase [Paraphoma chrysanthemicola]